MPAGGRNNLKHKELNERYHRQPDPKAKYTIFFVRVVRYGYTKQEAIKPGRIKSKPSKTEVKEDGRVCTNCLVFKPRGEFAINRVGTRGRTCDCKKCRREKKRLYRQKTNGLKDKEYRQKKRKLEVGEIIAFLKPVLINGCHREDRREVIKYEYKKGYQIQSIHTRSYRRLDTNDNHKVNKNCKRFYRIKQ